MAIGEALASAGLGAVFGKLTESYLTRQGGFSEKVLKENIWPHVDAVYKKCSKIKTLLNPSSPTDFLKVYNDQRFKNGSKEVDQYGLVEICRDVESRIIISGSGGSGKSMFMKYLWISLFETSDGRIPIFVELRNINSFHSDDIETYLQYTITQGPAAISADKFRGRMKRGDFIILLDGFDEVNNTKRAKIKKQIVDLSNNYPTCPIVISSRPDDDLVSWSSFDVYNIMDLSKEEARHLILKSEFDNEVKLDFAKKLQDDFYDRFPSFMSNPLLCSIMLLTYSYNLDLPSKMHLFFEQAFNALYRRHDSYKEGGYEREFLSRLAEDDFRRVFAYFCLVTYNEQKFEFDEASINDYIRRAISIVGVDVESGQYLRDLCKSVCLIIKDGFIYTFSHRSFQEYFTAFALCYYSIDDLEAILRKFANRTNDQVLALVYDMKPNVLREEYVLPVAEKYNKSLGKVARSDTVLKFALATNVRIRGFRDRVIASIKDAKSNSEHYRFYAFQDGELAQLVTNLRTLDRGHYYDIATPSSGEWRDGDSAFLKKWLPAGAEKRVDYEIDITATPEGWVFDLTIRQKNKAGRKYITQHWADSQQEELSRDFKETGVYNYLISCMKSTALHVEELKLEKAREKAALADALRI